MWGSGFGVAALGSVERVCEFDGYIEAIPGGGVCCRGRSCVAVIRPALAWP